MKIESSLFQNKKTNPFHNWIEIILVICYKIAAIQKIVNMIQSGVP